MYLCKYFMYRIGEGGVRGFSDQSGWIFMEAANTLFTVSKSVTVAGNLVYRAFAVVSLP